MICSFLSISNLIIFILTLIRLIRLNRMIGLIGLRGVVLEMLKMKGELTGEHVLMVEMEELGINAGKRIKFD